MHINLQSEFNAGMLAICTVVEPGVHGAGKVGIQAPGVGTPSAAAVCAAVGGLGKKMHRPNGATLTIGLLSMMFAAGLPPIVTRFAGNTLSEPGNEPPVHWINAPATTGIAMVALYLQCHASTVSS